MGMDLSFCIILCIFAVFLQLEVWLVVFFGAILIILLLLLLLFDRTLPFAHFKIDVILGFVS